MSIPRAVAHVPYLGRLHSRWQVANILAEGNAGSASEAASAYKPSALRSRIDTPTLGQLEQTAEI